MTAPAARVAALLALLPAILFAPCMVAGAHAQDGAAPLVVTVSGARPGTGQVMLSVFDSEDAFLKRPFAQRILAVGATPDVSTRFDLPSGLYAVSAVYDENSNGQLDTNLLGIPAESVGMSNDARALFGPPDFEAAAFELPEDGATIAIRLSDVD